LAKWSRFVNTPFAVVRRDRREPEWTAVRLVAGLDQNRSAGTAGSL